MNPHRNRCAIALVAGGLATMAAAFSGGCGSDGMEAPPPNGSAAATGGTTGEGGRAGQGGFGAGGVGGEVGAGGRGGSEPGHCSQCHGNTDNAAPPQDVLGRVDTGLPGVGAHQAHLAASSWHGPVACEQCHIVPTQPTWDPAVPTHMNGIYDIQWGPLAQQGSYDPVALNCSDSYCHGGTLGPDKAGSSSNRTPVWTRLDGSQDACGGACHTLPPGGNHTDSDRCELCHGEVIANFDSINPQASIWSNAHHHINGVVDVSALSCTSCHGDAALNDPAPPLGTQGETLASQPAVGAHQDHLQIATGWHRDVMCSDCHVQPGGNMLHTNLVTDFDWTGIASNDGAAPGYASTTTSCSGVYCHGATLLAAKAGGTLSREPDWTVTDGSYDACGVTCHTNPPGETHPSSDTCETCHAAVVGTYDAANPGASIWNDPTLHINGVVDVSAHHVLPNWVSPIGNANHHGSNYFLTNQQMDEHGERCSDCHGADYNGGSSGVSCNNTACHGGNDWRSCDFCHGTQPGQSNPPQGVGGELISNTLAVGRHVPHLTASASHMAFLCTDCHVVPSGGDVSHAVGYVPTADLSVPGHHGDVSFSGPAFGMQWNVAAASGNPTNRRGTCVQACHSDGNGGPPNVTPWWAGGTWANSCTNCHDNPPNNGEHSKHVNNENIACIVCHQAASSPSHLNGQPDVRSTISGPNGGGVSTSTNGACGNNMITCSGNCHGENHNPECWP